MKNTLTALLILACVAMCLPAGAYVLTVDDITKGSKPVGYAQQYGLVFGDCWNIGIHSNYAWWTAHSGTKVLICRGNGQVDKAEVTVKEGFQPLRSFGAYFSAKQGVIVKMTAYAKDKDHPVATVNIGVAGQAVQNQFVQVSSAAGDITLVELTPVSDGNALLSVTIDDVTVEPVPAP